MDPALICFGSMALIAFAIGGAYLLYRRSRMKQALVDTCLLCDGASVTVRNRDGEYSCASCGFDTDFEVFPATASLLEQYRDLRNALDHFDDGMRAMKWAQVAAAGDIVGGRTGHKYQRMEEASASMVKGFELLRDLLAEHPDLLEMPVAGENISGTLLFTDVFFDNIISDVMVIGKIAESKKQIEGYVGRLRAMQVTLRGQILTQDRQAAREHRMKMGRRRRLTADDIGDDGEQVGQGRGLVMALAALVIVVVLGAAAYVVLTWQTTTPDTVLVAVRVATDPAGDGGYWWGSDGLPSSRFADTLGGDLRDVGFEVIDGGDPEVVARLVGAGSREDILDAASDLGAAHVVVGELVVDEKMKLADGAVVRVSVRGRVEVLDTASHEPLGDSEPLEGHKLGGGESLEAAVSHAADNIAAEIAPAVLLRMLAHPDLVELFARESRTSDEIKLYDKLRRARGFVAEYDEIMGGHELRVADARKAWDEGTRADDGWRNVTKFDQEELLIGVLPNRGGIVATVKERRPWFSPASSRVGYTRPPERIEKISLDGKKRERLVEVYNIFSYPSLSHDGKLLVFVTDDYGHGMTLRALNLGAGDRGLAAASELVVVESGHYLSSPRLSNDGKWVAYYHRQCRRCDNALVVIGTDGKARRELIASDGPEAPYHFLWLSGDDYLLDLHQRQAAEGPARRVVQRTLSGQEDRVVLDSDQMNYRDLATSGDGTKLAFVAGDEIATLDLEAEGAPTIVARGGRFGEPSLSHRGDHLVFEIGGGGPGDPAAHDAEVATIALEVEGRPCVAPLPDTGIEDEDEAEADIVECQPPRRLTRNDVRDRYPRFAPDSPRVFVETLHESVFRNVYWMMIRHHEME